MSSESDSWFGLPKNASLNALSAKKTPGVFGVSGTAIQEEKEERGEKKARRKTISLCDLLAPLQPCVSSPSALTNVVVFLVASKTRQGPA